MSRFRGKIVVVTGAGSGIGLATARAFAAAGARVQLVDIAAEQVEAATARIGSEGGVAAAHVCDCTDPQQVEQLAASIFTASGRVDVLQNGVGGLVAGGLESLSLQQWQRSVDLNLWSVIHGVRAFVPRMLEQGGDEACLVNISSLAGLMAFPFTAPYSACKFAVVGLSEVLDAELYGRGVRVTVVCPGAVRTNLMNHGTIQLPGSWDAFFQRAFPRHAVAPEQVAAHILRAVQSGQRQSIPSIWLRQLWRLRRWGGAPYQGLSARVFGLLRDLGGYSTKNKEQRTKNNHE